MLYVIHKHDHMKNLEIMMVEVYKCLNNTSLPFTWDYFKQKINSYDLRNMHYLNYAGAEQKRMG